MKSPKKYSPFLAFSLFLILNQPSLATSQLQAAGKLLSNDKIIELQPNKSKDITENLKLLEKAIDIAQNLSLPSQKIKTLSDIAVKLAKTGNHQHALQIFDQVIKLSQKPNQDFSEYEKEEILLDISIKLAQAGFIEQAVDFGKKIPSNLIKAQAFNEISLVLTEQGQIELARKNLDKALEYTRLITRDYYYEANGSCANYKHEILAKIAANLSLQAQLNKALQIAQTIYGCTSASGDYTQDYQVWAFLGILNNLRQVEAIKQTWYSAQKISSSQEKAIIWSKVAVKMADMGETSFALSIAKKLAHDIPVPTTINSGYDIGSFFVREKSLTEIGIALAQKRQFQGAMEIAQTLTDNKQSLPKFLQDYVSYPKSKISLVSEIGKQMIGNKKISEALQLIKNIPDKTTKTFVQIAVASELQKHGQQSQAKNILKAISLPPAPTKASSSDDYLIFRDIAVALVVAKQTEKAVQMAQTIPKEIERESTLTDITIQLVNLGEIKTALGLIKNLQGEGSKNSIYQLILVKLIEQGQLEEALQILNSQSQFDALLIRQIAEKLAIAGKKEQAIKTAESIKEPDEKAKTLAAIALLLR